MFFGGATKPKGEMGEEELMVLCNKVAESKGVADKDLDQTVVNLIKALGTRSNEPLQLAAVLGLVGLAEKDANKVLIVQKGALAPLVQLCLSTDNDRGLYGAARLLWHLSTAEKNKFRIASEGGFQVITLMAASLISHIQYASARILLLLAEDENLRDRILDSNLPNTLSELLCSETDSVQYVAANTINYLASQSPECEAFSQDRVISKLMDLVKVGNENCQWAACSAIRAISQHEPNRLRVLKLGIVPYLVSFIKGPSERLQFVAMQTLISTGVTPEAREQLLEEGVLELVASLFTHSQDQLANVSIRLVGVLSQHDDARNAVLVRVGFRAFVDLLVNDRPLIRIPATTVLAGLLEQSEVQFEFFKAGLLEELLVIFVSQTAPMQHVMASVTVLYALSTTMECKRALAERENGIETLNNLASQDLIASLILSHLAEADLVGDVSPVETFLESSNYTAPHHSNMIAWDSSNIQRILTLTNSIRPTVRILAVWTCCCIASISTNVDSMIEAKAHETLAKLTEINPEEDQAKVQIRLASEAIKLLQASGPVTGDVGERFESYVELIEAEKAPIDKIMAEYGAVVKTLDGLDLKRIRQQASVFEDKSDLSDAINRSLAAVRRARDEITKGEQYQQIKAMDDDIRLTINMIEELRKLKDKAEVVEKLREQMKVIEAFSEEISRQNKTLERERGVRDALDAKHVKITKTIEAAKNNRETKNARVLAIMTELVDLQYQIENNPGIKDELTSKKNALLAQLAELEARRADLAASAKTIKGEIEQDQQKKNSYEGKLKELATIKAYADRLQSLKKAMQNTVGDDLADNEDYKALQGSMLGKVFVQLEELCTSEPTVDAMIDKAESLDGNAKERAMTGSISRVDATIRSLMDMADDTIRLANQKLAIIVEDIAKTDIEISRLKDEIADLDRQMGDLLSPDELEARIAELKAELAAVRDAIDSLDARIEALERERKDIHNELTEASSKVAGVEAAVRRFSTERKEARKSFEQQYKLLNEALDNFFDGYNTYILKREVLKAKIRALEDLLREWKQLFVVEAEKRAVADAAIKTALIMITSINDALEETNEKPLLTL